MTSSSTFPVLSASKKGSFAYKTVKDRMPVIVTKVIDFLCRNKKLSADNPDGLQDECSSEDLKSIIGKMSMLRSEMQTNKPLRLFSAPSCLDDIQIWNQCLVKDMDGLPRWFDSPWLLVECYMYRVLYSIFEESSYFKKFDPFRHLKEEAFFSQKDCMQHLSNYTISAIKSTCGSSTTSSEIQDSFKKMLQFCLWGNRNDLSLSSGNINKSEGFVDTTENLKSHILVDDSLEIWSYIQEISSKTDSKDMSILLDNAGLELVADLCFAAYCLSLKLFDRVFLYVKKIPWYVSDVTLRDLNWTLQQMRNEDSCPEFQEVAEMCFAYIQSTQLVIIEESFWTNPLPYHQMQTEEPRLYEQLGRNTLLVFKGDLNYRKLGGDIEWPTTTSFSTFLQGFHPAPLIAIRTIKAEIICGLPDAKAEELQAIDENWMVSGEYGLIQFFR